MDQVNNKITSFELDQLKEVVNIGASYSSTALSQLLKKKVMISVPEAIIDNVENIAKMMGNNNEPVSAVVMKILGDIPGVMAYLFPHGADCQLAWMLTGEKKEVCTDLNDLELSALREVGNILTGASLSALSKFLGVTMLQSVSEVVQDMLSSIFNTVLAEMIKDSEDVLVFRISFKIEGESIDADLTVLLDPASTTKILELTGKKI
jgi:chemotaxis protein CheC